MNYKAIILDLDNTIYPVSSIGYQLFPPLFQLIKNNIPDIEMMPDIERDIMRKPFQWIAGEYHFSDTLTNECLNILTNLTYDHPINFFPDYEELKGLPCKRFLVTMGFTKMQKSKVIALGIENDFEKIYIIDPAVSNFTKKDVFKQIMTSYHFDASEIMVVGDDPNSEIKAGNELGIKTILYDRNHHYFNFKEATRIVDFRELLPFFEIFP